MGSLAFIGQYLPAYAFPIDWNWPQNMIPSNPREIDRAIAAYSGGDVDTAIIALNGIKGAQNEDCRARHILVDIYRDQKRYTDALRELQDLYMVEAKFASNNTSKPGWMNPPGIRLEMADVMLDAGQYQEAIALYRELAQAQPSWTQPRYGVARAFEALGEFEQARGEWKSILSAPGVTASEKAGLNDRIANLDKVIAQQAAGPQGNPQAVPGQGQPPGQAGYTPTTSTASRQTGYSPQAGGRPLGSSSISAVPSGGFASSTVTATRGSGPLSIAAEEISSKKYDAAITRLKGVIQKSPNNAQAHYLLAVAYVSSRQFASARDEYEATLKFAQDMTLQKLASAGLTKIMGKQ